MITSNADIRIDNDTIQNIELLLDSFGNSLLLYDYFKSPQSDEDKRGICRINSLSGGVIF